MAEPHLLTHLSKTLTLSPPQSSYPPSSFTGLPTSHTGTAYLFLSVSAHRPLLQIHSYPALHWARAYISNIPVPSGPELESRLGLTDALAGPAVRACITRDLSHVRSFLSLLTPVLERILSADPGDPATCLLHGLAGTLYLLRITRHWVPSSAPLVSRAIVHISEYLLSPSTHWHCPRTKGFGVVDGELGTLTQLVLTSPPLAARLSGRLESVLGMQDGDGAWPLLPDADAEMKDGEEKDAEGKHEAKTGFAGGAEGLVLSLLSLRPFFPDLQDRIDDAISRAREYLWNGREAAAGETSLFHGVLGTASAFPKGPQRDHLLTLATPQNHTADPLRGPSASPSPSPPTASGSVTTSYDPGAAWMWTVAVRDLPRMIFYNDV